MSLFIYFSICETYCTLSSLLDKVFSGSVGMLVNTMARQNSLTRADIDALYQALREAEEGDK